MRAKDLCFCCKQPNSLMHIFEKKFGFGYRTLIAAEDADDEEWALANDHSYYSLWTSLVFSRAAMIGKRKG